MSDKAFVDSNIWLYALSDDVPYPRRRVALTVVRAENVVISTQVVNEVARNLIRKAGYTEDEAETFVTRLYERFTVVTISKDSILKACALRKRHFFSYWDSLIVAAALESGCTTLYSEDMGDGMRIEGELTIRNPFA